MTETIIPRTTDDDVPTTRVTFVEYHRPAMPPGRYTVEVDQAVSVPGRVADSFSARRRFTVSGDRLTLAPGDVYAVFPPDGSLGDHSDVLPHVLLGRSSLPWEFTADGAGSPWLALLLVDGQESLGGTLTRAAFLREYPTADGLAVWDHLLDPRIGWLRPLPGTPDGALVVSRAARTAADLAAVTAAADSTADSTTADSTAADTAVVEGVLDRFRSPHVVSVADLRDAATGPVHWPGLPRAADDRPDTDLVTVIDVEKHLLATLLPSVRDLRLLCHVRRAQDDGQPDQEWAAVLGNRLPRTGGVSAVHLVSVEGRYPGGRFDLTGVPDGDHVRLVCLKTWRFACVDPQGDLTGLLTALDRSPSTLRLPPVPDAEAERHLVAGQVPLAHRSRTAGSTVSWYRGPLIPGPPPADLALPAPTADALLRYDPAIGMFDVSYAAAWELGRLLAVQSTPLATSLYSWKRAHAQALRQTLPQTETWLLHPGWTTPATDADPLPPDVVTWFDDLRLLRGVPFGYLVPDDRLLPPESIRFVQLDQAWVDCLVDGAFSIGRVTGTLKGVDHEQKDTLLTALAEHPTVTGFLLRSSVVAGWPGLQVDAYGPAATGPGSAAGGGASGGSASGGDADARGRRLEAHRVDRLGPDVLLCLFTGVATRVDVHVTPETLHFSTANLTVDPLATSRVVDVGALADALRADPPLASSELAAKVVATVPRVTFTLDAGHPPPA